MLEIYLITTLISWATFGLFAASCTERMKREGYKGVKIKKSLSERFFENLSILFKISIPLFNIAAAIITFFSADKLYEGIKEKLLSEGKLEKIDEENNEEEIEFDIDKDTMNVKKYNDLSVEEKIDYLEKEKEHLLREKESNKQNEHILRKTYKPE